MAASSASSAWLKPDKDYFISTNNQELLLDMAESLKEQRPQEIENVRCQLKLLEPGPQNSTITKSVTKHVPYAMLVLGDKRAAKARHNASKLQRNKAAGVRRVPRKRKRAFAPEQVDSMKAIVKAGKGSSAIAGIRSTHKGDDLMRTDQIQSGFNLDNKKQRLRHEDSNTYVVAMGIDQYLLGLCVLQALGGKEQYWKFEKIMTKNFFCNGKLLKYLMEGTELNLDDLSVVTSATNATDSSQSSRSTLLETAAPSVAAATRDFTGADIVCQADDIDDDLTMDGTAMGGDGAAISQAEIIDIKTQLKQLMQHQLNNNAIYDVLNKILTKLESNTKASTDEEGSKQASLEQLLHEILGRLDSQQQQLDSITPSKAKEGRPTGPSNSQLSPLKRKCNFDSVAQDQKRPALPTINEESPPDVPAAPVVAAVPVPAAPVVAPAPDAAAVQPQIQIGMVVVKLDGSGKEEAAVVYGGTAKMWKLKYENGKMATCKKGNQKVVPYAGKLSQALQKIVSELEE